MGLGLLKSESKRFQFATLRLRGKPGRDGCQSALWDCFGDRICRHVENASPKTVPQCTLTTISTRSPAQGLYLWGKRAVWCGGKGKKIKYYQRSLQALLSLSRLRKPRVSSRVVYVFLACDPSRNPLCPSGCWLSTLKPHSGYSKETIREVVLSTGVYSQSDGLYTGRLRLKGVHGLFWLQVNETIKG